MKIKFENLGTINKSMVTIGNLDLYFSYKTIVAFQDNEGLKVTENLWGNTTGKLLNELEPDKTKRLNAIEFERELKLVMIKYNFEDKNEIMLNELKN